MFHPGSFTCKATGVKVSLKTAVICTDPATGSNDIYLRGKEPLIKPTATKSVLDDRVTSVPDANMRTTDRHFNIAGKNAERGAAGGSDLGSAYGTDAVVVTTQSNAPKPPTTVQNANLQEKLHNGNDGYTGATGEAPAGEEPAAAE